MLQCVLPRSNAPAADYFSCFFDAKTFGQDAGITYYPLKIRASSEDGQEDKTIGDLSITALSEQSDPSKTIVAMLGHNLPTKPYSHHSAQSHYDSQDLPWPFILR